jgi:hypothetical protein
MVLIVKKIKNKNKCKQAGEAECGDKSREGKSVGNINWNRWGDGADFL